MRGAPAIYCAMCVTWVSAVAGAQVTPVPKVDGDGAVRALVNAVSAMDDAISFEVVHTRCALDLAREVDGTVRSVVTAMARPDWLPEAGLIGRLAGIALDDKGNAPEKTSYRVAQCGPRCVSVPDSPALLPVMRASCGDLVLYTDMQQVVVHNRSPMVVFGINDLLDPLSCEDRVVQGYARARVTAVDGSIRLDYAGGSVLWFRLDARGWPVLAVLRTARGATVCSEYVYLGGVSPQPRLKSVDSLRIEPQIQSVIVTRTSVGSHRNVELDDVRLAVPTSYDIIDRRAAVFRSYRASSPAFPPELKEIIDWRM